MGAYHLMGLGESIGAVTGPVSYLAHRFERWDDADRRFFGLSGELEQRKRGEKVGEIQALVLFTTAEVFEGRKPCKAHVVNPEGRCPANAKKEPEAPMRDALRKRLPPLWRRVAKGRPSVKLYWCLIDRTDLRAAFGRAARVLLALRSAGGLGKEIWVNLTGGNNVTQLSLQLAAQLTGQSTRFYYVQAADSSAETCIHFTSNEGYWLDLPLLPVGPNEASRRIVRTLVDLGQSTVADLYARLKNSEHWTLFENVSSEQEFERLLVRPMTQQGLLGRDGESVRPAPGWKLLEPYFIVIDRGGDRNPLLSDLTAEDWFHEEELSLV